jgi:hypothetical protein
MLIADYVYFRFPVRQWRSAAALAGALPVAGSVLVVKFATSGQGYRLCLFLMVAAFRLSISAVDSTTALRAGIAGYFAAAAAASSLLTAPVWLVFALWLLLYKPDREPLDENGRVRRRISDTVPASALFVLHRHAASDVRYLRLSVPLPSGEMVRRSGT